MRFSLNEQQDAVLLLLTWAKKNSSVIGSVRELVLLLRTPANNAVSHTPMRSSVVVFIGTWKPTEWTTNMSYFLGVHKCGFTIEGARGKTPPKGEIGIPLPLGIYTKANLLKKGFSSWVEMKNCFPIPDNLTPEMTYHTRVDSTTRLEVITQHHSALMSAEFSLLSKFQERFPTETKFVDAFSGLSVVLDKNKHIHFDNRTFVPVKSLSESSDLHLWFKAPTSFGNDLLVITGWSESLDCAILGCVYENVKNDKDYDDCESIPISLKRL